MVMKNVGRPLDNESCTKTAKEYMAHRKVLANSKPQNIPGFFRAVLIVRTKPIIEAKLLLPLKTLAYGVPSHCFRDYFQMSRALADKCCKEFDKTIISHCQKEYKRIPDEADLKYITNLHLHIHKTQSNGW
jgi:hypothetical protein